MNSGAQVNFQSPDFDGEGRPASAPKGPLGRFRSIWEKRPDASPKDPGPKKATESEFRVCALGTRGVGKTLLLSAIHQRLSVQSPEIGFYLEIPSDRDRIHLTQMFDQIADPDQPWPKGTAHDEIREFDFRCLYSSEQGRIPLFGFKYVDYPGGLITDLPEDDEMNFVPAAEAERADAVIALLDGQKILHHLRGDKQKSKSLDRDLRYLVPNLARLEWKAIHFVVTKWDILEAEYSFETVRDALLQFSNFRALADQRRGSKKPIHLIPVSAVGRDFAMLDEQQIMRKRKNGGSAEPLLVEMTLAMTLTDAFVEHERTINRKKDDAAMHWKYLLLAPIFLVRAIISLLHGATAVVPLAGPFRLDHSLAAMVLGALDNRLEEKGRSLKREAEAAFKRIEDQRTALNAVLMKQAALRVDFEKSFPASNLTRH